MRQRGRAVSSQETPRRLLAAARRLFRKTPQRAGRRAERRAERLLNDGGLRTLTRNYARRTGEIDLVMLDGDTLVFVEVRYRRRRAWGSGLDSVDAHKQRRLARIAALYLADHPEHGFREARFDVVSAWSANYGIACEWIPNAFEAMDC